MVITYVQYCEGLRMYNDCALLLGEITQLNRFLPNLIESDCKINFILRGRQIFCIKKEDDWFYVLVVFNGYFNYHRCDRIAEVIALLENIG